MLSSNHSNGRPCHKQSRISRRAAFRCRDLSCSQDSEGSLDCSDGANVGALIGSAVLQDDPDGDVLDWYDPRFQKRRHQSHTSIGVSSHCRNDDESCFGAGNHASSLSTTFKVCGPYIN